MAVQRNTYSPSTTIDAPYLLKEKESGTADFVIIDMPPSQQMNLLERRSEGVVWVQIEKSMTYTVLSSAPSNVTAFTPAHPWGVSQVLTQDNEVFVVEYQNANKNKEEQTAVTGYSFGNEDIVYLKVDRSANTATIYKPN